MRSASLKAICEPSEIAALNKSPIEPGIMVATHARALTRLRLWGIGQAAKFLGRRRRSYSQTSSCRRNASSDVSRNRSLGRPAPLGTPRPAAGAAAPGSQLSDARSDAWSLSASAPRQQLRYHGQAACASNPSASGPASSPSARPSIHSSMFSPWEGLDPSTAHPVFWSVAPFINLRRLEHGAPEERQLAVAER
jgi:hypothetical protein